MEEKKRRRLDSPDATTTPTFLRDLDTPCFVVNKDTVERNAQRMRNTCARLGLKLRPHTKTHKTLEGALLQTGGSKRCLVVSTLAEAEFYASHGFDDIVLAYPITESKIPRCLALMERLERFHVMVSGPDGLATLSAHAGSAELPPNKKWSIVLEVDVGDGRTGFPVAGQEVVDAALAISGSPYMTLESVYCHCGNSYSAKSRQEREAMQEQNVDKLCALQERFKKANITCAFGTGSTPTCSVPIDSNRKLSEFHPGNYLFYDYEQYLLNVCAEEDIACKILTRVIAHHPEKNMILVDCGFTAISHDGMRQRLPHADFCLIQGESNLKMVGMSQEIGKIVAKEGDLDCDRYPIGTIFSIVPYHSCATANNHQVYYVHCGDQVVEKWTPVKGW